MQKDQESILGGLQWYFKKKKKIRNIFLVKNTFLLSDGPNPEGVKDSSLHTMMPNNTEQC